MQSEPTRSSSPRPKSQNNQFKLTIIDDDNLIIRLEKHLPYVIDQIRWASREFQKDPYAFTGSLLLQTRTLVKRQLTANNLIGLISAACVIVSLALLIVAFDRRKSDQLLCEQVEDVTNAQPVLLVLTRANGAANIYPNSPGLVGVGAGRGEGSATKPARAGGGGSGGMGDLTPTQIGKIPPPSPVPAVIPNRPPAFAPSLPAAGVDLDPLLWQDIKFPGYGDPESRWAVRSSGLGQGGGMGTNEGLGIGVGSGNGYGRGKGGNTGDGGRQIGFGGAGGNVGGGIGVGESAWRSSEVDQKVRLLSKPEPHYSEEARRNGVSGTVVLRVVFSSSGEITNIRAIQTLPFGLTEQAIAAARAIKFIPAMKGGAPVSVFMQLEYNFNLY